MQRNSDAIPLAGGQSLLPAMRLRLAAPRMLVDLQAIGELVGISVEGGRLRIGAMTRHADVAMSTTVAGSIPALCELAAGIGDQQIRNLGTLGGSLANNDPAACYPAAALALAATISTNRRTLSAEELFCGLYETALQRGELLESVSFVPAEAARYVKFNQPASRFALVGVFVAKHRDHVRVGVTGAGLSGVFRATQLEEVLDRSFTRQSLEPIRLDPSLLASDLHGSAEYRAHLIKVLTQRAVASMETDGRHAI